MKRTGEEGTGNSCPNSSDGVDVKTVGWEPTCDCGGLDENGDFQIEGTRPCVVLDPFVGSGTAVAVAVENGRDGVGIDLSEKYLTNNAVPRIEGLLLGRPALAYLAGREAKRVQFARPIVTLRPSENGTG